jgi:F0F1-type ATP synthase assembly protein I
VSDLSAKRELNNGFGNALNAAVEIVVTPVLMGLIGWKLDDWLGTSPLLLVFLAAFTLGYVVWRQYTTYEGSMAQQEQHLLGRPRDRDAR